MFATPNASPSHSPNPSEAGDDDRMGGAGGDMEVVGMAAHAVAHVAAEEVQAQAQVQAQEQAQARARAEAEAQKAESKSQGKKTPRRGRKQKSEYAAGGAERENSAGPENSTRALHRFL